LNCLQLLVHGTWFSITYTCQCIWILSSVLTKFIYGLHMDVCKFFGISLFSGFYNWNRDCEPGRTSLVDWSASHRDRYLITHNTHKRQTSIPPVVFEPTVPATERLQTHTQDHAATGICSSYMIGIPKFQLLMWCSGSDTIVGIAVCYGLDGLGIESQWGQHRLHPSRPTLEPTQPPIQRVLGLFPRIKRPGPVVHHPPPKLRIQNFMEYMYTVHCLENSY